MRTAESVTEGHVDKMCDRISDAVLDAHLAQDPMARVGCEVMCTSSGTCIVAGEITSKAEVDIQSIVYRIWPSCVHVIVDLKQQSPALSATVDVGANDSGIVIGYATDETPDYMPLPIAMAHHLTCNLAGLRKSGLLPYLRPDGKAQVTVNGKDVTVIVISTQHDEMVSINRLRDDLRLHLLSAVPRLAPDVRIFINAQAGRFEESADTGLTGRKIIMDAYGPEVPDGGGAFSGKDASKLDRSGAYMLRHIARNVVSSGRAHKCKIEAAYCIGVREPVALDIRSDGDRREIEAFVRTFPLNTPDIIEYLNLRRPIYEQTACYGHFGSGLKGPWERIAGINNQSNLLQSTVKYSSTTATVLSR